MCVYIYTQTHIQGRVGRQEFPFTKARLGVCRSSLEQEVLNCGCQITLDVKSLQECHFVMRPHLNISCLLPVDTLFNGKSPKHCLWRSQIEKDKTFRQMLIGVKYTVFMRRKMYKSVVVCNIVWFMLAITQMCFS